MRFGRGTQAPTKIPAREGEAWIRDKLRLKTEVSGHPHGYLNRIIGADAGDHERLQTRSAQIALKIGSDEGTVGPFRNDHLARLRRGFALELIADLTSPVRGSPRLWSHDEGE